MRLASETKLRTTCSSRAGKSAGTSTALTAMFGTISIPTFGPRFHTFTPINPFCDFSFEMPRINEPFKVKRNPLEPWLGKLSENMSLWVKSPEGTPKYSTNTIRIGPEGFQDHRSLQVSPNLVVEGVDAEKYVIFLPSISPGWRLMCVDGKPLQRVTRSFDGKWVSEDADPAEVAKFDAMIESPEFQWLKNPALELLKEGEVKKLLSQQQQPETPTTTPTTAESQTSN